MVNLVGDIKISHKKYKTIWQLHAIKKQTKKSELNCEEELLLIILEQEGLASA